MARIEMVEQLLRRVRLGAVFRLAFFHQGGRLVAPLFHAFQIRQNQLGFNGFNVARGINGAIHMDDVVVLKAAHHVYNGVHLADVREEFVPQALAPARAAHQARDVHEFDGRGRVFFRMIHFA